jgi:hypothetical protein
MSRISNDRFYTTDYTREVYTAWGYEHAHATSLVHIINRHSGLQLPESQPLVRMPPDMQTPLRQHPGKSRVTPTKPVTKNS